MPTASAAHRYSDVTAARRGLHKGGGSSPSVGGRLRPITLQRKNFTDERAHASRKALPELRRLKRLKHGVRCQQPREQLIDHAGTFEDSEADDGDD